MVMGIAEILCSLQESRRNYRNVLGFPWEWRQNVTGLQRHREKILEDYCVDFCGSLQAAEIESLSTSTDCCTSGDGWRMGEHFYGMVRNGMEIPQGWASTHTHTHTYLTALILGWAGTRKVKPIWILLEQETVSGNGISWATCKSAPSSRQITMPPPHHSVFYRSDALPATQPTESKHWRPSAQMGKHGTETGWRWVELEVKSVDVNLSPFHVNSLT